MREQALAQADLADKEALSHRFRSPFHDLRIVPKASIGTPERLSQNVGSLLAYKDCFY